MDKLAADAARPLRLWPGVVLAVVLLIAKLVVPAIAPEATPLTVLAGPLLALAIGIWWAFFSRVPMADRWGALLLIPVAMYVTSRFLHASIKTGMMGYMFPVYGLPIVALTLVAWAAVAARFPARPRRMALVTMILIACGAWTLVRTGGFSGYIDHDFALRWTKTAEDRLLAQASDEPPPPPATPPAPAAVVDTTVKAPAVTTPETPAPVPPASKTVIEWPGFRGPSRDGIVRGVRIATDWTTTPPTELWRRPIGPGWSSFAVHGDLIFTQEQRGGDEIVSAYNLANGTPAWRHHDTARFWESNGGAGPRATPAVSNGRVYALGATGLLNALDARTGARVWSHDAAADTGAKVPDWGFSGSPLVVDDLVIVATGGILAAYDAVTGARRWIGPAGEDGYTSPRLMTIEGVRQVVHLSGTGLASVTPADGKPLWQYEWKGYPIVQPSLTADGGILIVANESSGTRRVAVTHGAAGWTAEERWTSNGLKPWFNDFVVHNGHAFGFDGTILSCIDLAGGARKWKGGRYGGGQLVLLPEQDLLLVVSEEGDLALVSATPDQYKELGHVPALSGKTWNHPVVAGDVLLVRNGEEMAAFRLTPARPTSQQER